MRTTPFAALNAAFFQDGGFVYVPAGKRVEAPIHLLFISTAKEAGATSHPRNLILAEKGSQVTVLESYVSTGEAAYFTNAVTELVLGEGAVVEHCKFQDESRSAFHMAAVHAQLGRGCNFISHSIATGARLSRNNIRTALAGEGVECILNGLYLTRGDQLADHHMVVEHAQPHCNSHEYYNGILDGRSKGVFHGRILVRPAAQKTDAKQTNKNLLLSEDATVDTKPQLEIYADDVKCTHGATVGQLNEESIFYLRAAGHRRGDGPAHVDSCLRGRDHRAHPVCAGAGGTGQAGVGAAGAEPAGGGEEECLTNLAISTSRSSWTTASSRAISTN